MSENNYGEEFQYEWPDEDGNEGDGWGEDN